MQGVKWWTVAVQFSSVFIAMILQGTRWWVLLRPFAADLTLRRALSCHFRSLYYSLVLPNSTAQEIVRAVVMSKDTGKVVSWSASWLCKLLGVLALAGMSLYGLVTLSMREFSLPAMLPAIIGAAVLMLLAVGLSFSKRMTRPFRKIALRILPHTFVNKIEKIRDGVYRYRYRPREVIVSAILTFLTQFVIICGVSFTIAGITGSLYFTECMAFIPLIEIISMVQPFTPNGIGVRDALYALMFSALDLSSERLGIYIVISNLTILLKLLGAVPVIGDAIGRGKGQRKT